MTLKGKRANKTETTNEQNRAIWLVYRTDTNARGVWLVKRTLGWKNVMPENFLEINRHFALTRLLYITLAFFTSILVRPKHWALFEHFSDFFGETEHFIGKNGALRWSISVGKQKHNVQKPSFDVIPQHDWPIEQSRLYIRVFFGGKTRSPCFDLCIHWLIKQITSSYRHHFSRWYENRSIHSNNVFQYSKIRTRKRNAKKSIKTVKNWNPALFGIRNPLCWNPESSTRNPESTAWNPESKNVLDSLTWGDTPMEMLLCLVSRFPRCYSFNHNHT